MGDYRRYPIYAVCTFEDTPRNIPCPINAIKNVVEPDITIVCDSSKLDEKGCKGSPDMIIEILYPSTAKTDKVIKFAKYEKAGVREYWVLEPEQKLVSVFVLEANNRYGRPEMYTDEDTIRVSIFSDLKLI